MPTPFLLRSSARRPRPIVRLVALAGLFACWDPAGPGVIPPAGLEVVGGDGQRVEAGSLLPEPLSVRVTDMDGQPLSGVRIQWSVEVGGGSIPAASTTDERGEARAEWTIGVVAREYTATARTGQLAAEFRATGTAGSAARIVAAGGDEQEGVVGMSLIDSLMARVTDEHGNPVQGVVLTWTPAEGGGSAHPTTSTTGEDGIARTAWELGSAIGKQTISASVPAGALSALAFTARATPGVPSSLSRRGGDAQSGIVGSALADSLVVAVADAHGNPVGGVQVSWAVVGEGGVVTPAVSSTGVEGTARTAWVLGTAAGPATATASLVGGASVSFTANAHPGAPASVQKVAGDNQTGRTGAVLSDSLVVRVADEFGNPVSGIDVGWEVVEGDGFPLPEASSTDGGGRARTAFVLGSTPGSSRVAASVAGAPSATFAASATMAPRRIVLFGDSNLEIGWQGRSPEPLARSYIGSRQYGLNLSPDDPHHPTQLAGKVEAEWSARHGAPLMAVNHAIGGTHTGSASSPGQGPNAREAVHGLERFRAEVLGEGYLWNGGESGIRYPDGPVDRMLAFTPTADDFALISMGTNDPTVLLSPAQTRDNIRWMIQRWKDAGLPARNLIITTLAPAPRNGTSYPQRNALLRTLAEEEGVALIDLSAHVSDDDGATWRSPEHHLEGDDIHYAESVREWLAEEVVKKMEEAIFPAAEPSSVTASRR